MFTEPIEAVTVCVDYDDFLNEIAPFCRPLLDRWIIVTRPRDEKTRAIASKHSIECVLTDDFDREPPFSKARGINAGLRQLQGKGWLVHLDGDCVLPGDFRQCLADADMRKGNIYGCNRLCVPGWDTWQELKKQGVYSRWNGWLAEYRARPAGCYVGGIPAGIGNGYTPIGFFQMWHSSETLNWGHSRKWYPHHHNNAARTDTQFSSMWDRVNRIMIPELMVFHLESENHKDGMGHNWNGRKTPRFEAPVNLKGGMPPMSGEARSSTPKSKDYC